LIRTNPDANKIIYEYRILSGFRNLRNRDSLAPRTGIEAAHNIKPNRINRAIPEGCADIV
jgi:hypothetical protein